MTEPNPFSAKGMWRTLVTIVRNPRSLAGGGAVLPIVVLFLYQGLHGFDLTGVGVLLPEIRKDFSLSLSGVTAVASAAAVLGLLLGLPLATLADRGRHRTRWLAGATFVAGVATALTGLAPTFLVFLIARLLVGGAYQVTDPVQQSLLADYSPVEQRATIYSGRYMVLSIGQALGPLFFGLMGSLAGWRPAFLMASVLGLALAYATTRLREPIRGGMERRAMGVTGDDVAVEEAPPRFEEAIEILKQVGTVRRLWYSVPFLVGGLTSLGLFLPLYLESQFHLGPASRGVVTAVAEPFAIIGLILGIPIATRMLASPRPERLFTFLGVLASAGAGFTLLIAIAPTLPILIGSRILLAFAGSLITPGLFAAFSLVFPPRARTVGFALTSFAAIPGLLFLRVMGGFGDAYGLRWGIVAAVPVFLVGALILASSGSLFRADILRARMAALAALDVKRAREAGQPKLLVCRGVDVSYGPTQVLFGVNFDVEDGEMVALLGTNGAGKSTFLRAISGTVPPSNGAIVFDGRDISAAGGSQTAELGISQVPGGRGVFPSLTVEENLGVARWLHRDADLDEVLRLFPILRQRFRQPAGELSGGEQQMLTLAMAFLARPRLLMIDELSLGLAPLVVQSLLDVVRRFHERGTTVILVEQSVNVALTLCHRAVFMEKGEVRFEGPTAELLERPDILRSVFLATAAAGTGNGGFGGRRVAAASQANPSMRGGHARTTATDDIVLEARGLEKRYGGIVAVDGVSLALRRGEILGIIGANGAGKTTIFDLLTGYQRPDRGTIRLDGIDVTGWSADRRARAGLGRSFQSAMLFPSLTVEETIAVALDRHLKVRDPLSTLLQLPGARDAEAATRQRVDELIDLLQLDAFRDKFVSELSTGSRRIVDLACRLAHRPSVLLLDEPSSGVAQRETEALGPLILRIQAELDCSIVVVEHDIPLVRSVADRLVALETGRVIAEGPPGAVLADPSVMASYLGTDPLTIQRSGLRED